MPFLGLQPKLYLLTINPIIQSCSERLWMRNPTDSESGNHMLAKNDTHQTEAKAAQKELMYLCDTSIQPSSPSILVQCNRKALEPPACPQASHCRRVSCDRRECAQLRLGVPHVALLRSVSPIYLEVLSWCQILRGTADLAQC